MIRYRSVAVPLDPLPGEVKKEEEKVEEVKAVAVEDAGDSVGNEYVTYSYLHSLEQ